MSDPQQLARLLGPWQGSGCRLVLGVPSIPTDSNGNASGTLAQGASGAYNTSFTVLAHTLVNAGFGHAILRLGWEFDGGWFKWSVSNDTDAANFAAYWRQIVTAMRAVPGASFSFDWNPSGGLVSWNINNAYPGDAYVDEVGLDRYDQTWNSPQTPQVAWNDLTTMPDGMNWLASFGTAHAKPITLPEWGVSTRSDGHGLGDDPSFVNRMETWIASNHVAWTSYFNFDEAPNEYHAVTDGRFPNSLTALQGLFATPPPPPPTTVRTTTTTISASPATSSYGQTVSASAAVTPAPTGGTVQFTVDGVKVGGPLTVASSAGHATTALGELAVGSHQITAGYTGDITDGPSTASATVNVTSAPSSLVGANASVSTSLLSRSVRMAATLTSTVTSAAIPGQQVAFATSGNGPTCTATTTDSGVASCTVQLGLLSPNPTSYTAAYAGNADHRSSTTAAAVH